MRLIVVQNIRGVKLPVTYLVSICDVCFSKRERDYRDEMAKSNPAVFGNWSERYLKETWREPLLCAHCGRPVRIPRRYKLKLISAVKRAEPPSSTLKHAWAEY